MCAIAYHHDFDSMYPRSLMKNEPGKGVKAISRSDCPLHHVKQDKFIICYANFSFYFCDNLCLI